MTTGRLLPMLEIAPPPASAARSATGADDARLTEFRPESRALPSFYVWTLGCQMNHSDSEEMAGRLLAAGCASAAATASADLIVINTCATREAAEAKVIGRQGELARLKDANPSLRVVMTGCAVREMDRERLDRRFPAVDMFLRPDQEPELVDRLGLASVQGPIGITGALTGATTIVGRSAVGVADHLPGTRAAAVAGGAVHRHSSVSAWLFPTKPLKRSFHGDSRARSAAIRCDGCSPLRGSCTAICAPGSRVESARRINDSLSSTH